MSWDRPGACASAIVSYTFVWTKYPAPLRNAWARAGFTRIPTPRPTPPATTNRYPGTSNHTRIWLRAAYHGRARTRGVRRTIANRIDTPIVSWFRTRSRNSSTTKYTRRITGTYAHPCQESAIAVMHSPARSAYRRLFRFSPRKARTPVRTDARDDQFSTHRRGCIDRRARR